MHTRSPFNQLLVDLIIISIHLLIRRGIYSYWPFNALITFCVFSSLTPFFSDASDGNDFETDSFRLPPTSNWKNLLSSAATSSLHVTLQQDYDTEIRPHPTVSPGASGQQSSQVYRSTEDSGMNSPSYSKLTKDFNTALGNALGNLTTVPPVQGMKDTPTA